MSVLSSHIISYAILCHQNTNHLYDNKPYVVHLAMVVSFAYTYLSLIPEEVHHDVLAACWLHDVMEDCRETYNDVAKTTNVRIADMVYALTNEKGRTRKERADARYYEGIRQTPYASFVKLCDRMANAYYSREHNNRMLGMYRSENQDFIEAIQVEDTYFLPMSQMLEKILKEG